MTQECGHKMMFKKDIENKLKSTLDAIPAAKKFGDTADTVSNKRFWELRTKYLEGYAEALKDVLG
jgi:hypothetical protein